METHLTHQEMVAKIRTALKSARNAAKQHRHSGLHRLWQEIEEALEILDRLEEETVPRQLGMFGEERRPQAP